MPTIFIENKPYQVEPGQNLLKACLSLGLDLPYFCWHPAMHSVGACRQCAVKQFKDEKDTRGRIIMACMTPVSEGMRISINDPEARAFRKGIIELLMLNHPHDCPVCDEGGECHLQDMTVMTGHAYRSYRFGKRTHRNQYLGPFINHEMNRCIQCYRCVRFYRDYAGGRDLDVFGAHDHVYFGRHSDGVLECEFSGNLVEICPTGVFTDKTFKKHYTRKWDLQTAPSVCVHCGLGCNIIPGERYGRLRRILNRFNRDVNGFFICDRGRFGYEFVNSTRRITRPLVKHSAAEGHKPVSEDEALERAEGIIRSSRRVLGIGSPRASLEANFALRRLVGPENFFSGLSSVEDKIIREVIDIMRSGGLPSASLRDVEEADAVLVLGEDVMNTSPRLGLSIRQAVKNRVMDIPKSLGIPEWNDAAVRAAVQEAKGPLYIASLHETRLDDIATGLYHAAPDDIARFGFMIAKEIDSDAPGAPAYGDRNNTGGDAAGHAVYLSKEIAKELIGAKSPVIVSGAGCMSVEVVHAAFNIASALLRKGRPAKALFCLPECDSMGAGIMAGRSIAEALDMIKNREADALIILENDLYRRIDSVSADSLLCAARGVIVLDYIQTPTADKASLVLPSASFAESDGTFLNSEGRAQRFFRVYLPEEFSPGCGIKEGWRWLGDLMTRTGRGEGPGWNTLDDVILSMTKELSLLTPVAQCALPSGFRIEGMKIPRQPHRYSGRTAMHADKDVHERQPQIDNDSFFSFSMEGYPGVLPTLLAPRYWRPGWNSVQALNKFGHEKRALSLSGYCGVRLFGLGRDTTELTAEPGYFMDIPPRFRPKDGEYLFLPLYHIFGSEELSMNSAGIAELAPEPYIALSDIPAVRDMEGKAVEARIGSTIVRLRIKIMPGLPVGTAGYPVGLPGVPWVELPQYGKIIK